MLNIPLAISAQAINYNLPGLGDTHIKLSGPILAGIYSGKITMWNDPAIRAANPGVDLPAHKIIPIHRVDGSGDTFIFTQYLSDSTPSWASTRALRHHRVLAGGRRRASARTAIPAWSPPPPPTPTRSPISA